MRPWVGGDLSVLGVWNPFASNLVAVLKTGLSGGVVWTKGGVC